MPNVGSTHPEVEAPGESRWATALLAVLLLAVGAVSWHLHLSGSLSVDADALSEVPLEFQHWQGRDIPMQGGVEEMLDADYNLQRAYVHPVGGLVFLYVGYYGTERGGRPEHTPWACYPTNGWKILERNVVTIDDGLRANEILVEKDGERRLVHFWYQSSERTGMLGGFDHAYERLRSRIVEGRADGSLVRLSTPLEKRSEQHAARARLMSFGRGIVPILREHWPHERPAATS